MLGSRWLRSEVDAGWAWVVSAASFALQFVVLGTAQSFGIIYGSLMQEFNAGEAATAWVGALAYGLVFLNSPVTAALCEHFGCRAVTCTGSILCMTGLLLSSYATSISTLYLSFSLLWGFGASLAFFPSMLTLRFFFDRKMSQANGISMSGAGVGTLVMNIVLKDINDRHGWRGCMRVLCGLTAVLFLCGCMFRPPPADFYGANQWSEWSKKVGLLTKLRRMFDSRPWKVKGFAVWVLAHSTILFAYFVPYVHLIQLAKTLGISTADGALLVGYLSITAIIGKLLCGRLADFPQIKRLYLLAGSALALAASNFGVTAATNYDGLLTYVLIFGFFDGCFVVVVPQVTQDIVGLPLAANALGCQYGLSAVTMTLGPPVTGQIYRVSGSYNVAFFVGAALILVGVVLLYFVQRLRPDLTASKPWPELITGQQQSANLIPGSSIESLISGLDTLSGCITNPSPVHLSPGQIELGDYRRFGHRETESKTSHLEFEAPRAQDEGGPHELEVISDVTSISLECASLESDTADRRSFGQDSTGPAILLHTTDQYSYSDVSRDSVVSEMLAVPLDVESVRSGSALSYTGNISISGTDLEGCNVLDRPGNYEMRSNVSTDASITGISGEIESNGGDDLARNISKEEDILVDVSSSETLPYGITSATAVDVQSLVSWESTDHQIPQTGSEMEMIKLPPPPASTKQDVTPSLITLETAADDDAVNTVEHGAVNLELKTSSTLITVHDNKAEIPEKNENLITMANDIPHIIMVTSDTLNQEEGWPTEIRSICTAEPRQNSEDLACRTLLTVNDSGKMLDQSHAEADADGSIKSKLESSRDGHLSDAFQGVAERLPPQEQWLLETEKRIIRGDTASSPPGIDLASVDVSCLSSDISIQLMDETVAMSAGASTEEQDFPPIGEDVAQQLTVGPYDLQPKQSAEASSGPLSQESASESSLDEKEQPIAQEELVRLPPPPRIPRTGTLIVVQDDPSLNPFTAEDGISGAEDVVKQVLEECVTNDRLSDSQTSAETVETTSTVPSNQVETHEDSFMQENDAFIANQAASSTLAASVDVEYVQLPPPLAMPRIGTLILLEEHEHERVHHIDNEEHGKAALTSTESDSALILLEGSPKLSTTALSPDLLSIEEQDPLSTRRSIGVFHRGEPRSHTSINEPSQLSLLSQRLEAMAARQFEEEQSEASSTSDSMAFMVSSNQSTLSTPLFSANHSVPLTPMRAYSSYLATPAPTAAQTPFSVPFSPTDASTIQTPAESSILHSPVESITVNSDIKIEFDFEPSRHNSFIDDTRRERDASGSFGHLSNPPPTVHAGCLSLEDVGTVDIQAQSVSGAVYPGSQLNTACLGMATGLEGQKSKSDLFNSEEQAQDPQAVAILCTNPFLVQSVEDSSTSNSTENSVRTPHYPTEQSLDLPAMAEEYDGQHVYPGSQLDTTCSDVTRALGGQISKSDLFNSEGQAAQDPDEVVAPFCTNPFLLQSSEDSSYSNSTEDGLVTSQPPADQSLNIPANLDKYDEQHVYPGSQLDTACLGMAKRLEGQKSESDLFNAEEQAQDPDEAVAFLCTNPFVFQSVEDIPTSNSTKDGSVTPEPPAEQSFNIPAITDEYDEQSFSSAPLGEFGERNTEKEQVLPQDLNSLFSNNPFQPPTLSEATESSNAHPSALPDPWCPQAEFPVDSCVRIDPPPPTSRRKRTSAILDNQVRTDTDGGQDFVAHLPIVGESKEQVELPESVDFEVRKEVVSTDEYGYQEPSSEQQANTRSPKQDIKADRDLPPSQSEQIPEVLSEAKTNLEDDITNPLLEVISAGDVQLTIHDAVSSSDNDVQSTDNVSNQSYDVRDKSDDVTTQTNDVIIQSLNYILMRPDDDLEQSEKQLEMQSPDRATIEPVEAIGHSRTSNNQSDEGSTERDDEVTAAPDDVISQRTEHQPFDDDRAPLLHMKEAEFCFVTVEDGELERTSSSSSVTTDESSSTETSLSENEMPYHKLQAENSSCGHIQTQ